MRFYAKITMGFVLKMTDLGLKMVEFLLKMVEFLQIWRAMAASRW